jgi:hypothetical protein
MTATDTTVRVPSARAAVSVDLDLGHHGHAEVAPGPVDLADNARRSTVARLIHEYRRAA